MVAQLAPETKISALRGGMSSPVLQAAPPPVVAKAVGRGSGAYEPCARRMNGHTSHMREYRISHEEREKKEAGGEF